MLEVRGLCRQYGTFKALHPVSFNVDRGEVVGLLGHNGAGKTTLLKLLTGVLEPSSGSVQIDGKAANSLAARRRIGYLPENCPLYPDLSIADQLLYAANLRGLTSKTNAIHKALAKTQLTDRANQRISTLSRGLRQRTGVAQALLGNPELLILDEPTNGLDPQQIDQMRQLIQTAAEQATVIVSTHILQEVAASCHRALILRRGHLVLDKPLQNTNSRQIKVRTRQDPSLFLRTLDDVHSIEKHGDEYLLTLNDDARQRSDIIAAKIVAEGLGLLELKAVQTDVDSLFNQVMNADE